MILLTALTWPVAHALSGGVWHWADLLSALLALVAVVGLTLVVRGRRLRAGLNRDS